MKYYAKILNQTIKYFSNLTKNLINLFWILKIIFENWIMNYSSYYYNPF